jgi:hypothetical protein
MIGAVGVVVASGFGRGAMTVSTVEVDGGVDGVVVVLILASELVLVAAVVVGVVVLVSRVDDVLVDELAPVRFAATVEIVESVVLMSPVAATKR